jgi:DNA invertase Pin-like site-specific DNA recombinase
VTPEMDLKGKSARGYVRRSMDDDRGTEYQIQSMEAWARAHELRGPDRYYVDLVSGKSTLKRSDFNQMLEDAKNGEFEVLLVFHTSRFARNRFDAQKYKRELWRAGVQIVFVELDLISGLPENMLVEGLYELIDEHYVITTGQFVQAGARARFRAKKWVGMPPYGYVDEGCVARPFDHCRREGDDDQEDGADPCHHTGRLVFDDRPRQGADGVIYTAAEVVGLIFARYLELEGGGSRILPWLKSRGFKTNRGEWSRSAISKLLSNPAYIGVAHWARRQKKMLRPRVAEEIPDAHPAIVTKEVFERARVKAATRPFSRKPMGQPTRRKRPYPMRGVARCGHCGGTMYGEPKGNGARYMVCSNKRNRRSGCAQPSVGTDILDEQMGVILAEVLMPEDWRALAEQFFRREIEVPRDLSPERLRGELERTSQVYMAGEITETEWMQRKARIHRDLAAATMKPGVPARLDEARRLLSNIGAVWAVSNLERREELVGRLFEEVTIHDLEIVSIKPSPEFAELFALSHVATAAANAGGKALASGEGEYGSGGRTRTYDQAVNSRPLYH